MLKYKICCDFVCSEIQTLFIFALGYDLIDAQRYEIGEKIGNKPISKIGILTFNKISEI